MNVIKKMAALLLAMCLLIGMPMSISAADVSATELRLVGAQPVLSAVHSADKAQLMYFNQAIAWNDSATVRVVVADSNNDVVQYNGNTPLYWKTNNGGESGNGYNGYRSTLNEDHVVTNSAGVTVDTWTEIIDLLANDAELSGKGYRLQIRMYDKAGYPVRNGVIDTVVVKSNSEVKLSANYVHSDPTSVGLSGDRDCAYIDIGTVEAGATEITPTGVVTLDRVQMIDETSMWLNFSEAVTIDTERTDAVMQVLGAATGTSQMDAAVSLSCAYGNRVKAVLTDSTWSAIKAKWQENTTRKISFKLTEKNLNAAEAEYANSYTVDTVQGIENEKPLQSNLYAAAAEHAERMDYVTADVEGLQTWKLTQNETVHTLIIPEGAKLNLNGYTLTVTALNSYGDLIDSTEGEGGLCLTGDEPFLSLYQDNAALPLYDAADDCYRFFTPEFEVKEAQTIDDNTVKYAIRLGLPSAKAYALLDDEDNRKSVFITLELLNQDDTEQDTIDYIFRKDIMEEYVTKSSGATTKYGIVLTVSGVENVTAAGLKLRATACVDSVGVQRSTVY